jgi:DNA-binding MarR family transcriptional regulator
MRIAKITRIHFNDTVREAGAQAGQDELFTVLSADTPTNVSEAAKRLRVRSATVSRMLDRLSKRGLVKRIVIAGDRRRIGVVLTPEGSEVQRRVHDVWCRMEKDLLGDLSDTEAEDITEGLTLLDAHLKKRLSRLR